MDTAKIVDLLCATPLFANCDKKTLTNACEQSAERILLPKGGSLDTENAKNNSSAKS